MNKKSIQSLNLIILILLAAAALAGLFYIVTMTLPATVKQPKTTVSCDNSREIPPAGEAPLDYYSAAYHNNLKQQLDDSRTSLKYKSGPGKIGQANVIAGGERSVVSKVDSSSGVEILTSQKTSRSDLPLGWEFAIAEKPIDAPVDFVAAFSYKSDASSDVGVTYRGPGAASTGETFSQLEPASQWTQRVVYLPIDKIGKIPALTISSNNFGTLSIKNVRIGQIKHRDIGKGLVSLAFDDGWESVYNRALPLFEKYNIPTTQFIVSDFSLGKQPLRGYLTVDQIKKIAAAGHEIASHSLAHCNAREMRVEALTASVNTSQQQFADKLGAAPKLYAHPFGSYDDRVVKNLSQTFAFIRSSDEGLNSAYYDPHNIKIQSVESYTTIEQIKNWVNQAAAEHKWLVLLYHKVGESGEYNVTTDQLEQQLALIKNTLGLEVVTASRAIEQIAKLH